MKSIEELLDKVLNRQENIEKNNVLRQEAMGDSLKGWFYDIYGTLSAITMKQMDIKTYSKRIEEKLGRLLNQDKQDKILSKLDQVVDQLCHLEVESTALGDHVSWIEKNINRINKTLKLSEIEYPTAGIEKANRILDKRNEECNDR